MMDLQGVFDRLKPIYAAYARDCHIVRDEPGHYYLGSHEVRAKDGYRTGFGGVEIRKNYVSAHLMPVYTNPELLESISDGLRKRMQGKSCFNFKKHDAILFDELEKLVATGIRQFRADGRL